jgi:hypothetical protein
MTARFLESWKMRGLTKRVQDKLKRKLESHVQQAFEGFWWR